MKKLFALCMTCIICMSLSAQNHSYVSQVQVDPQGNYRIGPVYSTVWKDTAFIEKDAIECLSAMKIDAPHYSFEKVLQEVMENPGKKVGVPRPETQEASIINFWYAKPTKHYKQSIIYTSGVVKLAGPYDLELPPAFMWQVPIMMLSIMCMTIGVFIKDKNKAALCFACVMFLGFFTTACSLRIGISFATGMLSLLSCFVVMYPLSLKLQQAAFSDAPEKRFYKHSIVVYYFCVVLFFFLLYKK